MLGIQALQELAVVREPEEPVTLLGPLQLAGRVEHALAVGDLVFALEELTADAVPALIRPFVEIVRRTGVNALDQRPRAGLVCRLGRPDELVVRNAQA